MSIDPRIAARRAEVREMAARADARRTLWWMAALVGVALLVWIARGPLFSVQHLTVSGVERANPAPGLAAGAIEIGSPLIMVRADRAVEALEADPWILDADITVTFPDRVGVRIVERQPVLRVRTDTAEFVVAVDGVVVAHGGLDGVDLPITDVGVGRVPAIGSSADDTVRGLAEFVHGLPESLAASGDFVERDGELWFEVAGISARLGRPVEMGTKATVLASLLEEELTDGSIVHLVAPLRPSVLAPETDEETGADDGESVASDDDGEPTGSVRGDADAG